VIALSANPNAWAWEGVGPLAASIFLLAFVVLVGYSFWRERGR
jgi:hypothetical protein